MAGHVPVAQNKYVGAILSPFLASQRIIDGDGYYIVVSNLESPMTAPSRVVMRVPNGNYMIASDYVLESPLHLSDSPWVLAEAGAVAVDCNAIDLSVVLDVVPADDEPGPPDLDAWERVMEVSVDSGEFDWPLWVNVILGDLHVAQVTDSWGSYRLRFHERGGAKVKRLVLPREEPLVEEHLLVIWPAPVSPERVWK